MRRILFVLVLSLGASSATACGGGPTSAPFERTLAAFQPYLTRDLTPVLARDRFGTPDEETGSGLRIYKYRIDAGRTLWLAFPGDAPIVYAKLQAKDGAFENLVLR